MTVPRRVTVVQARPHRPERLRGIMVDAARLPEPVAHYRRLIDFCREWNLNALLFRLTDDQGSALRWQSHPELVTHPHALAPAEARDLARYGEQQGVMVIPEIESFGHTRYISGVPRYAHLEDRDPRDPQGFTGLCPLAPETLALMTDLYREVAAIFPSPYLHGGCDEVNWGGSALSRQALQSRSRAEIWAEYVNALEATSRGLGKELIIWGDLVLHREPDILPRLDRRVILMDWRYQTTDPRPLTRVAETLVADGRRVLGAPAVISCAWGPRPGARQLGNIDAFADAYAGLRDPRCLGVVVTNWVPSRYLQGALWDSLAYAAVALAQGGATARRSAFPRFVERFHGAGWTAAWQQVFETFYRLAPSRRGCAPEWPGPRLAVPWASDEALRRGLRLDPAGPSPYRELRAALGTVADSVRRHEDDFAALALSAEYLEHLDWRQAALTERGPMPDRREAVRRLATIAARDRRLLEALEADWNRGRFADAPGKLAPLPGLEPADQLLLTMRRAAAFSADLAHDDDRLVRLLAGAT
jgi:hypothetical protein